jgi:hypothetical protein
MKYRVQVSPGLDGLYFTIGRGQLPCSSSGLQVYIKVCWSSFDSVYYALKHSPVCVQWCNVFVSHAVLCVYRLGLHVDVRCEHPWRKGMTTGRPKHPCVCAVMSMMLAKTGATSNWGHLASPSYPKDL